MDFEPGTAWRYNNSGYFLLGAIIEKISGQTYADFLEQRIFKPMGMANTAYEGHERGSVPRAAAHSPSRKRIRAERPDQHDPAVRSRRAGQFA
jgi:D-alanyl-D-alanine carboxypeptidase